MLQYIKKSWENKWDKICKFVNTWNNVKIGVKTVKSGSVKKDVYYMDSGWILTSNVCCWSPDVNMLDINGNCWEKVFVGDKLKNKVINIYGFLG